MKAYLTRRCVNEAEASTFIGVKGCQTSTDVDFSMLANSQASSATITQCYTADNVPFLEALVQEGVVCLQHND